MVTYKHVTQVVRNRCINHLAKRVDSRALLLQIATPIGALIIWITKQTNTNIANQTNKLKKSTVYVSTYEHVNEVVRNSCVKHKEKRQDSRATLLLIATSVRALIILIIKQKSTNIVNQTNKLNK